MNSERTFTNVDDTVLVKLILPAVTKTIVIQPAALLGKKQSNVSK